MATGVSGSTAERELERLRAWKGPPAGPIARTEHEARLERARGLARDGGADAVLILAGPSLRYFTGLGWSRSERLIALLLPVRGRPIMICPRFERESLAADLRVDLDFRAWEEDEDPSVLVGSLLADAGASRLALDPDAPFSLVCRLRSAARRAGLTDASAIVDGCRMYKSPAELALLGRAKAMTLEVQRSAGAILHEGITTTEVHHFLDEAHVALGAEGSSFRIVQFGVSTTFMHANPAELSLREGDMVLIDTGCTVEGYNSDITRSYVFGKPSTEQRTIWEIEREAQQRAFEAARPGVACEQVDRAARTFLESRGFGPGYVLPGLPHRTGHGIGLSLHEPAYLVRGDRTPLAPGMCFSNEPMIVLPGKFAVRLEDHFHVTANGATWFTLPPPSIDDPLG